MPPGVSALRDDAESVHLLAEAVLQPVYAFCFYRVGDDTHRCEEVVQETLVSVEGNRVIFSALASFARRD